MRYKRITPAEIDRFLKATVGIDSSQLKSRLPNVRPHTVRGRDGEPRAGAEGDGFRVGVKSAALAETVRCGVGERIGLGNARDGGTLPFS